MAELWFGTHPLGMSTVETASGRQALGHVTGDLGFMLKVLAPAQPLSIQVHPARDLAAAGFAAEEKAGLPLSDIARDYKDPHHKPEMVYALTPFETLVGFRPMVEAVALLEALDVPVARDLVAHAEQGSTAMVGRLLGQHLDGADVDAFVAACAEQLASGADIERGYLTVVEAATFHPSDPGLVLALLLNRRTIPAGGAAFIGSGLIHAHLSGLCLEVMAPSDNVFRAGLTPKRVNAQGVLESLAGNADVDPTIAPRHVGTATELFAPDSGEFALTITRGAESQLPGSGSRVLLGLDGVVEIVSESAGSIDLAKGQAAIALDDAGFLEVRGTGTVAQAYVP